MTDQPPPLKIEHVQRPPLPWRDDDLTECGLTAVNHPTITRTDLAAKIRKEGQTRAAYTTCQTCLQTAQRHPSWEEDPVGRLSRELTVWRQDEKHEQVRRELVALAALVAAHPVEFRETLDGLADVGSLDDRRVERQRRAADSYRTRRT